MLGLFEIRGGKMNQPVRLQKDYQEENDFEVWILNHAHIILPICFVILFVLFIWLCFAITGVSATDSGVVYNHMQDVI